MRMSDENVFDLELMFIDVSENGGRVETRVEDGRLASDFVPDQVGINGHAIVLSGDHSQLAPTVCRHRFRQPAFGNSLELNPIEQEFGAEFGEAAAGSRLSCFFHSLILRHSQPSRLRCDHWLSMGGCTGLTEDITQRIFESHADNGDEPPLNRQAPPTLRLPSFPPSRFQPATY